MNDLRYTVRRLRASPGFTAAALATMALGIGANSAIFSVVNAVMLRPMAVARPHQIVEIYTTDSDGTPATSSYPDYLDFRDLPVFDGGAVAYEATLLNLMENGRSTLLFAEAASGNYFRVLEVQPTLGRLFTTDDDTPGSPHVAVLGAGFWQRHFGGDPTVIGRSITINGKPITIVGVGPREYTGGFNAIAIDLWVPMHTDFAISTGRDERVQGPTARGSRSMFLRGRLAPGVERAQAQASLDVVAARLAEAYPTTNRNRRASVYPSSDVRFHPNLDRYLAPVAALLMVVPALVLLIACANIANLLLARATGRAREIAVRLAVGASRRRLVQQLLTESVTLAFAGGLCGLLLAFWSLKLIEGWKPEGLPIPLALNLSLDSRVVLFTAVLSIATGVLFGLAPSLQATKPALVGALKDDGGGFRRYRRLGTRNLLVVTQLAVSLVLLTCAGLFVRSLQAAQDIDPGFERERAIIFSPLLEMSSIPSSERAAFSERLRQRLLALPGVEAVALADRIPLGASIMNTDVVVDDRQPDANGRGVDVDITSVGPGYFAALGIPLIRGRDFSERDGKNEERVAIVSEAFVRQFWSDGDGLGRRVRFPGPPGRPEEPSVTVVGIARDTKVRTLGEAPRPYLYMASLQSDDPDGYVIRTATDPAPLVASVRREALALDPNLPILELKTMREHLSLMLTPPRLAAAFLGACGVLAVLLAALGLYAVVAFAVARRTKEIGIRVALGASRRQVINLVVAEGMTLVAIGLGVGFVLASAATRPLGTYLYGLDSFDPITFLSVSAVLAGTALLANYIPARRAVRVDALKAIRYE